jgi:hypothetical protein
MTPLLDELKNGDLDALMFACYGMLEIYDSDQDEEAP